MKLENVADIYPLSPVQAGMLFHSLYAPDSGVYGIQLSMHLIGELDVPRLQRAWQQVIDRHTILRTGFVWENRQDPLQVVFKAVSLPWEIQDWRQRTPAEQQTQATAWLEDERRRGFDLRQPPLIRCALMRLADQRYQFSVHCHHIITDGWSLPILFGEAFQLYHDERTRLPAPRPYRDYIVWQQQQDRQKAETFWRQQLAGFGAPTPLGVDHSPVAQIASTAQHATHRRVLSTQLTQQLNELARRHQLTLSTVIQGAWALLLGRYSGEEEVLFGVTVSGRPAALRGVEERVGLFINTLPFRVKLPEEATLLPWLQQLQRQQLAQDEFAYTPLVDIQRWSNIPGGTALFESILVYENYPVAADKLAQTGALDFEQVQVTEQNSYPLSLLALPGDQLTLALTYDVNRFAATTIERMTGHLQELLQGMYANPSQPISHLPLLTAAERRQQVEEFNPKYSQPSPDLLIHQRVEQQAALTPDAIALVFDNQTLTYAELNQRANQLAHHLRGLGVGAETLVAMCVERSLEMVIGVLAILKAGGAYVPLDPAYPADRLAFMLEDTAAPVLLTQAPLQATLPPTSAQIVCLDRDWPQIAGQSTSNLSGVGSINQLAYIIYTSGSTGKPKGVMVEHANVMRLFSATDPWFGFHAADVWTLFHSYAFDFSVWEIWGALFYGGKLVVVPYWVSRSPQTFYQLLCEQGVTVLNQTPSAFRQLMQAEEILGVSPHLALRYVIFGGEALEMTSLLAWYARHDEHAPQLINMYGITETTVHVTYRPVGVADAHQRASVIGGPIPDLQLYLLDRTQQPVPIGVAGELYVGGAGVARGYLNRPELTTQRFIANPVGTGRLYRTGDLARRLDNGDIEYLGRIDQQVKIRGFRIELGEIEAVLAQHPSVQEVVVIARREASGQQRLVAYVVLRGLDVSQAPTVLREHVRSQLPDYMTPAAFVLLERLPLTNNGKVDRKALPAPAEANLAHSERYEAPQTATEQTLAQIWREVLGLQQVGRHDNFFEVGGDSIVSLQVISRARAAGIQLKPRQVFEAQTIAALAQLAEVANAPATPTQTELDVLQGDLSLLPIQQHYFGQTRYNLHHFNQSFLIELDRPLDEALLSEALAWLMQQHDALRLRFTPPSSDGNWQQHYAPLPGDMTTQRAAWLAAVAAHLQVIDLSGLTPDDQQQVLMSTNASLQASLNITNGPLWRVALCRADGGDPDRLLFIIHHLAVDLVSWRILLPDLWKIYEQLAAGQPVQLPTKGTSLQSWARWLSEYAQSETLLTELPYWQAIADAQVAPLPLDWDATPQTDTVATAEEVTCSLSVAETRALLQQVPATYHTQINDLLLTALVQTLTAWSGQTQVLIDLEGHGREDLNPAFDLSRTVGWFTTLFPVLLTLSDAADGDPGAAVKAIKEQLRQIPQRGIGYGLLRYLNPTTASRLAAAPQPEISFNYGGQFSSSGQSRRNTTTLSGQLADQERLGYRFNLNGSVVDEQLSFSWLYSHQCYRRETVEQLAQGFITALQQLIAHCLAPNVGGYTPSDFPLARLSQPQLDAVIGRGQNVADLYPLSPMQAGMLFHSLYAPDSGVYLIQFSMHLAGELDVARLQSAWQQVIDRHTILRTGFAWEGLEQPVQIVYQQAPLAWDVQDWRQLSAAEQQERADQLLQSERSRGFDLRHAPLLRCSLLQLADQRYQLILHCHHIITDGWSLSLVMNEIFQVYNDAGERLPNPHSYRDYIAWHQQQDQIQAEQFWRQQLAGFTTPTPLAIGRLQSAAASHEDRHLLYRTEVPIDLSQQLSDFARRHHLTLNTLIQGAWALLLARYSGEEEVLFGVTVAGRPPSLGAMEQRIGLFINTLPLRVALPATATVLPWLQQLQRQQQIQDEFAYTPLNDIQRWSELPPGTPLFATLLVFENYPIDASAFTQSGNLRFEQMTSVEQTNYPITIAAIPGANLTLAVAYDTGRFDATLITGLLDHLQTLLANLIADPDQALAALPMLTLAEQQQLLVDFASNEVAYDVESLLSQRFEAQVAQSPDAVAVAFEEQTLTYRQLDQRANQLAHFLQSLGVGPEVVVGVSVERSLELIVALLGIFKAGGTYLPLDPNYPPERLAFMLADAAPALVITNGHYCTRLPADVRRVCLDAERTLINQHSVTTPFSLATPDHLAYIIYTSGSTGQPKGALLEQRGLCNLAQAQITTFGVQPGARVLQLASLNFDASIWEIVMALCSGATLVLAASDDLLPGPALTRTLQRQSITHMTIVPTALSLLEPADLPNLSTLIVAGEACSAALANRWSAGRRLFNAYGPTETTVCATIMDCGLWQDRQSPPPIGYPLANMQVYLLDAQQRLVPLGVPGELCVGGVGVGRGYHNRPTLTAEKFIANPFGPGRLYRTGDLARWLPTGEIEYLGRIDQQVKIRGFRIELGEIETVLLQHPDVQEGVVVAQTIAEQGQQLTAYIIPRPKNDAQFTAERNTNDNQVELVRSLRSHLQQRLPDYMTPTHFVLLDKLPTTPNGKVDRKRLPAPSAPTTRADLEAPQTPTEQALAKIWAEVLRIKQVGRQDNFFELGGHSLLATQIISRLRSAFGVELKVRTLFETPTLMELSQKIEQARQPNAISALPTLQRVDRSAPLPLSYAQQRLWFLWQLEGPSPTYNVVVPLQLSGQLHVNALHIALNALVARHESLRTRFPAEAGVAYQEILTELSLPLPCHDLRQHPAATQPAALQQLLAEAASHCFDLAAGPLLQATLYQLADDEHILLLNLHHIITDGWSMALLMREWIALYQATIAQQPAELPALTLQYADFAVWQRDWLQGERFAQQLHYWQTQLADVPSRLNLPADYARPSQQRFQGDQHPFALTPALSEALQELSRQQGVSLFMLLTAAFAVLLARYSGQDDLVIGTPIANRHHQALEPLVGFFVNTLALRVKLDGNPRFEELLQQVRQTTLDAYAHQDIPFEQLVNELQVERSLSHTPLFQVMLSFDNTQQGQSLPNLAGLTVSPVELPPTTAKFDLTLSLQTADETLWANLAYNRDLFAPATIARMADHLHTLLQAIVTDPSQPLATLPLLSTTEREHLLVELNETQVAHPATLCLHQRFERQVEQTPQAIAVACGAEQLSYDQLNRRANQLAQHLQTLGVRPETPVGLCVERSLDMIVAILGILKAGGAYVPLDPTHPPERLAVLAGEAALPVILTQSALYERFDVLLSEVCPQNKCPQMVCLDRDWAQIAAQQPSGNVSSTVTPANLVYVIFTSGSTGKPKGVAVEHRQLDNYVCSIQSALDLPAGSRFATVSTLAADLGNTAIFPTLCNGGTVVVIDQHLATEANALATYLRQHPIDCLKITPSHLNALLCAEQPADILPRQRLILGGEASSWELIERVQQLVPDCRIFNHYGPTETTVGVLTYPIPRGVLHHTASVPLGRPIGNTQVYILDSHGQPTPLGVPGELYIGGDSVTRGYYQQPLLTEARYIANPFGPGRLYRTGDLVRYLPNLDSAAPIEYLGRIDQQVKIRGFRIELGEIEAVLAQHPALQEAIVIAHNAEDGEKRLVAYVVLRAGSDLPGADLRAHLSAKLPDYMIPTLFVRLDQLPLNANGKVDRQRLPTPVFDPEPVATSYPRNYQERQLAEIWETVLGVHPVGIRDNFFALGGHSLLAVQLMARIQQVFGQALPLNLLFQYPTIEALAAFLRQPPTVDVWGPLVAIQAHGTRPPLFCVPGAGANPIYLYPLAHRLGHDQPFYGLQAIGLDGVTPPFTTIEAMAAYYLDAIKQMQPQGPYYLAGHSHGGRVAFAMAQQLRQQGEAVALLAILDTGAPVDTPINAPAPDTCAQLLDLADSISDMIGQPHGLTAAQLQTLDEAERLRLFHAALETLQALPPNSDINQTRGLWQVFQANANMRYQPIAAYPVPITLILAQENASGTEAENLAQRMRDGWAEHGPVRVQYVPGTHTTMMTEPQVAGLAAVLQACLE